MKFIDFNSNKVITQLSISLESLANENYKELELINKPPEFISNEAVIDNIKEMYGKLKEWFLEKIRKIKNYLKDFYLKTKRIFKTGTVDYKTLGKSLKDKAISAHPELKELNKVSMSDYHEYSVNELLNTLNNSEKYDEFVNGYKLAPFVEKFNDISRDFLEYFNSDRGNFDDIVKKYEEELSNSEKTIQEKNRKSTAVLIDAIDEYASLNLGIIKVVAFSFERVESFINDVSKSLERSEDQLKISRLKIFIDAYNKFTNVVATFFIIYRYLNSFIEKTYDIDNGIPNLVSFVESKQKS